MAGPNSGIANIELDLNQVMANGQTVIFGFQCDGWSDTWDYTINAGTPQKPVDQWLHCTPAATRATGRPTPGITCRSSYSRDSQGNVTYQSVWFDGVEQDINATVPSAFALGLGTGTADQLSGGRNRRIRFGHRVSRQSDRVSVVSQLYCVESLESAVGKTSLPLTQVAFTAVEGSRGHRPCRDRDRRG